MLGALLLPQRRGSEESLVAPGRAKRRRGKRHGTKEESWVLLVWQHLRSHVTQ